MTRACILVVDDQEITQEVIQRNLEGNGFRVLTAGSVTAALEVLAEARVDLVITDYKMPGQSGLDLIRQVRGHDRTTAIVMLTGYGSIDSAVAAVKAGADDYVTKPFTDTELLETVERALKSRQDRDVDPDVLYSDTWVRYGIIGRSGAMTPVYAAIEKASQNDATVLISGESGTGKELVARAVHYHHFQRATSPFIPVNCPGIPATLFESELFGHAKGAFTGADQHRKGFFQAAEKGSLFLDEVSELPLGLQAKLLRVLQEKEIFRVGESQLRKVDVRIIAATNKDLDRLIENGLFRQDLYYRLNVMAIQMPPLRDRGEDILLLAKHFAVKFARELGRPVPAFSEDAVASLLGYAWPGNIRELENLIQRLLIMGEKPTVTLADFPSPMKTGLLPTRASRSLSLEEMSRQYVREVLEQTGGNKALALKILKIDRKTLLKKLQ